MAEIDAELLERVARWCADAGRQAGTREIRAALSPLSWDELLAARAILADPPPARPLGPHALADMARGTPAETAADRERGARYPREDADEPVAPAQVAPAPRGRGAGRSRGKKAIGIVVHRARDRVVASPPPPVAPPALDELRRDEGRAVLERLLRRHGGRRAAILDALRAGWRRPEGALPTELDLAALLDLHGLARAFEHRERDELLHALRAAGGSRAAAATRLGLDEAALDAALARLGATRDAELIREERRADLRARATLSERVHLLLTQEDRLRDLGMLAELEADLRARLPEHLRALRAGGEPLAPALSRSLSLPFDTVATLASRLGLELGAFDSRAPGSEPGPAHRGFGAPRREFRPGGGARRKPERGGFGERRQGGSRGRSVEGQARGASPRGGPSRSGAYGKTPRASPGYGGSAGLRGGSAPRTGTRGTGGSRPPPGVRSRFGASAGPSPRSGGLRAGPSGSGAGPRGGDPRGAGPVSRSGNPRGAGPVSRGGQPRGAGPARSGKPRGAGPASGGRGKPPRRG